MHTTQHRTLNSTNNRLGLLFSDGSILVLVDGVDFDTANKEAREHDLGEQDHRTRVIRINMNYFEV
jgi:hypothetical protein